MNIQDQIFDKAFVDGKYDKSLFIECLQPVIDVQTLTENETTLLNFLVQEYNDKKVKDLTFLQFFDELKSNFETVGLIDHLVLNSASYPHYTQLRFREVR